MILVFTVVLGSCLRRIFEILSGLITGQGFGAWWQMNLGVEVGDVVARLSG